jgi:hypothetical protein
MAPRANWKGFLRLSLVTCPVALYPATSESEKVSFNQLNRKTGHRIKYAKVDADTGEEVDNEDIVKGYLMPPRHISTLPISWPFSAAEVVNAGAAIFRFLPNRNFSPPRGIECRPGKCTATIPYNSRGSDARNHRLARRCQFGTAR